MLKKTILTIAIASSISNVYAWKVVYDPSAAANAAKQLIEAKNQLDQLRNQVTQLKSVYQSFNGTRNIVDLLSNPVIFNKLPANYQDLYMGIKNAKSGKWADLYKLTTEGIASKNATPENLKKAHDSLIYEYDQKILESFDVTKQRIKNLEKLSSSISSTKDPKEIADLQARIAAEQLGIETDKSRLYMLKEVYSIQKEALKQQAENKWQESLNKPFVMPNIHVEIKKPFSK